MCLGAIKAILQLPRASILLKRRGKRYEDTEFACMGYVSRQICIVQSIACGCRLPAALKYHFRATDTLLLMMVSERATSSACNCPLSAPCYSHVPRYTNWNDYTTFGQGRCFHHLQLAGSANFSLTSRNFLSIHARRVSANALDVVASVN